MSDHSSILVNSQDYSLEQDHELVLETAHNLDLGQTHHTSLGLGYSYDNNLQTLDRNDSFDFGARQTADGHHLACQQLQNSEFDLGQSRSDSCNEHEHQLGLTLSNHELELEASHQLSVLNNQNFSVDHDLELDVKKSEYMAVIPAQEMSSFQLVQVRRPATHPSHTLTVGQEFSDVSACRRAVRDAAIAMHFEIQTVKSDQNRFTAKCASKDCPWRIHAAKHPEIPTFTIRTINDHHTCQGITHVGHHQASVDWVAKSLEARLWENPNFKPKEILEEIHRTHGIALSYKQAWRGKERMIKAFRESFEEGYRLLPQYCDQVKKTNPGSIASVYGNLSDNCFERLFISFHASIYGFVNACHPLISLASASLKGKYIGSLLLASSFDGDGGLFPLAFGIVDELNDESWMWFCSELRVLLETNTENMPRLTILSDRQKGIVDGVEANFPTAFHGLCMSQFTERFHQDFNNLALVNLLWAAAYALTVPEFEATISEIQKISQDAASWIGQFPSHLWASSFFNGPRLGLLTTNITELLKLWTSQVSGFSIIETIEFIRRELMIWFNDRRALSTQWFGALVPSAETKILEGAAIAANYHVFRTNVSDFEVVPSNGTPYRVDIRNRYCQCRGWQVYGLPCAHAVVALRSCSQNVNRYTESCFTVAAYRKVYSQTIHPIQDKTHWSKPSEDTQNGGEQVEVIINPPKSFWPPEKPRKRRVRAESNGREKRVVHCSLCNQPGHFRTTCTSTAV